MANDFLPYTILLSFLFVILTAFLGGDIHIASVVAFGADRTALMVWFELLV